MVRVAWLGQRSLSVDEADSVYFADHTEARSCDPHPPGYYVLLSAALELGRDERWVRLPSALAGTVTVPLIAALGRELQRAGLNWMDQRTSILAAVLLAFSPSAVWYAREARMYALTMLLGLVTVWLALRHTLRGRHWDALGYGVTAATALLVDWTALLPWMLANGVWIGVWFRQRRDYRALWTWLALQVAVSLPCVVWLASSRPAATPYQPVMLMLALRRMGVSVGLQTVQWALVGLLIGAAVAVAGWSWYRLVHHHGPVTLSRRSAQAVVILWAVGIIAAAIPRGLTVKRLLVPLAPYALLATAWAVRRLELPRLFLTALVLFSVVSMGASVALTPSEPWRELMAIVNEEVRPGDAVWVDELAVPAYDYYTAGSQDRHVWRAARLDELADTVGDRVWIVARADAYRNLLEFLEPAWRQRTVWALDGHRISIRAVAPPVDREPDADIVVPPAWLITWPSPMDPACMRPLQ